MFEDLAKQIVNDGGWLALAFILLLATLALISYTLYRLVRQQDGDNKVSLVQAETIAEQTTSLKEVSTNLKQSSQNLLDVVRLLSEHDSRASANATTLKDTLAGAITEMHQTVIRQDQQMEALPGKVRQEMVKDFEALPKAIEEALAPKIEILKADIQASIQTLDEKLASRLEAVADDIPHKTALLVRNELTRLKDVIEQSLAEMLVTAKRVVEDDSPDESEKGQG